MGYTLCMPLSRPLLCPSSSVLFPMKQVLHSHMVDTPKGGQPNPCKGFGETLACICPETLARISSQPHPWVCSWLLHNLPKFCLDTTNRIYLYICPQESNVRTPRCLSY